MIKIGGAYDKCLKCEYLGVRCDGPNTLSMTLDRWCEWCNALKKLRGMTNQEVSELSGVSLGTVDRIMAGKAAKDIMRSTAADVTRVLVGAEGKWPCAMIFEGENANVHDELRRKSEELEHLRKTLESIHESYKSELATVRKEYNDELAHVRKEYQAKVDFLKTENERKERLLIEKEAAIVRKDESLSKMIDKLLER